MSKLKANNIIEHKNILDFLLMVPYIHNIVHYIKINKNN